MVTQRNTALLAPHVFRCLEVGGVLICPESGEAFPAEQLPRDFGNDENVNLHATDGDDAMMFDEEGDPCQEEDGVTTSSEGVNLHLVDEDITSTTEGEGNPPRQFGSEEEELAALIAEQKADAATYCCSSCHTKIKKS